MVPLRRTRSNSGCLEQPPRTNSRIRPVNSLQAIVGMKQVPLLRGHHRLNISCLSGQCLHDGGYAKALARIVNKLSRAASLCLPITLSERSPANRYGSDWLKPFRQSTRAECSVNGKGGSLCKPHRCLNAFIHSPNNRTPGTTDHRQRSTFPATALIYSGL